MPRDVAAQKPMPTASMSPMIASSTSTASQLPTYVLASTPKSNGIWSGPPLPIEPTYCVTT